MTSQVRVQMVIGSGAVAGNWRFVEVLMEIKG